MLGRAKEAIQADPDAQSEPPAQPAPSAAHAFRNPTVQRADTARTEYLRDIDANDQIGALTAALEAIGALTPPTRAQASEALHRASDQFCFYADQHFAKTPPDEAKGRVNQAWADYCFGMARGMDVDSPVTPRATYTSEKDHALEQIVLHLKRFNGLNQSEFWAEVCRAAFPSAALVWPEGCVSPAREACIGRCVGPSSCPHAKRGETAGE